MVRKLLEADKPNLQILGTNSVGEVYSLLHYTKCRLDLVKYNYGLYWYIHRLTISKMID